MLRRDGIRNLRGVGEMLDLDGEEPVIQHALRFFPPRDERQLVADFHGNRLDDFSRSREQVDFLPAGTVLRLREQISGRKGRVCGVIGNDHHLARTRQGIHSDRAENLALGLANVGVAGTIDLVDGVDRRRAVGHCADRLHATETINFRNAREVQRREQAIGKLAVGIARREDRDLRTAGDFREGHRHQHGRHQRHLTAGDVKPDAPDGIELLAHERTVFVFRHPIFRKAPAVEIKEAVTRGQNSAAVGRREAVRGGGQVGRLNGEIAGPNLGAVKLGRIITHRFVPAPAHVGKNRGDGIRDFLRHDRAAAEGGQFVGKSLRSVMERAHERIP